MARTTRTITETISERQPDGTWIEQEVTREQHIVAGPHCQSCGSTDGEDIDTFANDGYSTCCNEIVVWDCDFPTCYHG